jgi:predicted amidohydrolase
MRVAVIQLTSTRDVEANVATALELCTQAVSEGADLIALPENHAFLGLDSDKLPHAQGVEDGPFVAPFREFAAKHSVGVLAGSIPETGPDPQHVYNTSVLIGRGGETLAAYRKIHLFDIDLPDGTSFRESESVAPGSDCVVAEFDGWRLGLTVCYDLRFPALYRRLAEEGAEILLIPAAFTLQTGKDHWQALLRARAIETQCYVVAPGQFGQNGKRRQTWGKSMVVDPWGTVLCQAPESVSLVTTTLSRDYLADVRQRLPCAKHHRLT